MTIKSFALSDHRADPAPARNGLVELLSIATVVAQFGLVLVLIHELQLESRTFYQVMLLALGGFLLHIALPRSYRLPFFALLSLASVGVAFGLGAGMWLSGFGLALIAICHLPLRFGWRVALLLFAGVLLGALRVQWLPVAVPPGIWPILGAMFMFRTALYLHAIRHGDAPVGLVRAVAYFFMLPNVSFPLFPVVDYKTFSRTHFDADPSEIYQRGARWMLRGVAHLLLYRLVYYHFALDPVAVRDLGALLQYLLATFALYLRVSGQFHLIVGVLHLFGFHLPETHHLYYLASSFTDFWRRINIYWKDFMMKLVYYPSFFQARRFGQTRGLVLATLAVFVATWLLHSYQWFWLRGEFPLTLQDALFWGILAVLVVANSLWETRRSVRQRPRWGKGWDGRRALQTVGTFVVICVLWSLWSGESVAQWVGLWKVAGTASTDDWALLGGLLACGLLIAGRPWGASTLGERRASDGVAQQFRSAGLRIAGLGTIAALSVPQVHTMLGPSVGGFVATLRESRLNSRDATLLQRGYYEHLNSVNRFNTQLWDVYRERPVDWIDLEHTAVFQERNDFMADDLRPSTRVMYKYRQLSTNRWGMRDRDYDLEKRPDTFRIAVLGPSDVMGTGVADAETFENLLEDRLNQELSEERSRKFEVLNFGVEGFSPLQQMMLVEERVLAFQPDVVMISAHLSDVTYLTVHLQTKVLRRGLPIPYDAIREIVDQTGWTGSMELAESGRRLQPFVDQILSWTYDRIAASCRARGAVPVVLLMRLPTTAHDTLEGTRRAAQQAGFTIIDLSDVYPEHSEPAYQLAVWDRHPNGLGHQLLADRLYQELRASAVLLPQMPPEPAQKQAGQP